MDDFDLFQVSGPNFTAGIIFKNSRYYRAAPIIRGPGGVHYRYRDFRAYARKNGWQLVHVASWQEGSDP